MSTFSVGQMNQLGDALQGAGFTPDDVTRLRASGLLPDFKRVLLGHAEVRMRQHVIDLDGDPFVPSGLRVHEHTKGGQFEWDLAKVVLYFSKEQQGVSVIQGNELREELNGESPYNANLLDYLLAHQELIPEGWKDNDNAVFFWGTIYCDSSSDGDLCVRCLDRVDGRWTWAHHWFDSDWADNHPAAVRAG
ncbi:MAG: hypothetical protein Q7R48_03330 [bacterium]|nr:hypothetical protein [bacterium]